MIHTSNAAFITDNFLLENRWAERLYHEFASRQPLVDYLSLTDARSVAEDMRYSHATDAWLANDPAKLRAMRTLGVPEEYVTGDALDVEKFRHFAAIVPYLVGHPLYHLVHMDLRAYFGIEDRLDAGNAEEVYASIQDQLLRPAFSVQGLLLSKKTEVLITSLDPAESLAFHRTYSSRKNAELLLIPGFQPALAYDVAQPAVYRAYLEKLAHIAHSPISSYEDLLQALRTRAVDFHELGCRSAVCEIGPLPAFEPGSYSIEKIFSKVYNGTALELAEQEYYRFETLIQLSGMYSELGWVQGFQLAPRFALAGQLAGSYSGLNNPAAQTAERTLLHLLHTLHKRDELTKTIVYPASPSADLELIRALGSFNDGSARCKVQWGMPGTEHFHLQVIHDWLNSTALYGNLSCSISPPSLSQSPLIFSKFDYFRRALCHQLGREIAQGKLPEDLSWLGAIVADICYDNAKNFFHL